MSLLCKSCDFTAQVVHMTVGIPKLQLVETFALLPDVRMVLVTQTSQSLGTARMVQLLDQVVDMPVGVPTCDSSLAG